MLVREALGDVLRSLRTDQGRTLHDVASDANVSTPYLSELERGRKDASSEVLATIAAALRTRLDLVMFEIADRIESGAEASLDLVGAGVGATITGADASRGHLVALPSVPGEGAGDEHTLAGPAEVSELAERSAPNAALLAA
ncbi:MULTISPECIES: helix-turn-helix domain-containing protein [unclassified Plantibacter]|jgi:transcriptional regulator with XRE-family HTH domain|uniref:helix-turn-helix domain-containing protein n=1 Tax=unclassified Plantibacter TaxID=2624265 RepID=UPI003D339CBC